METGWQITARFVEAASGSDVAAAAQLWRDHRAHLSRDPVAATMAGDLESVAGMVRADPGLIVQEFGEPKRTLLCWLCFSHLWLDSQFEEGLLKTAKFLLDHRADPNCYWMGEWAGEPVPESALYGAAGVLNHAGLTRLLLDAGADPNEGLGEDRPYRGEAVYHACDHPGHNECLRLLFEAGASQAARDYCLFRKLDFEDAEGVSLFIEFGANLNLPQPRTHLSHALLRGRSLAIIKLLLDGGADPNVHDADGTSAFVIARRYGNQAAAELLARAGADTNLTPYDALLAAASEGDMAGVKDVAAQHPEVLTQFSEYGRQRDDGQPLGAAGSILHDLARLGEADGLRALLEIGFDPNALNRFGESPLHWAGVAGRCQTAKVLLEAGAKLDVVENNHRSDPVGWTCWGSVNWQDPHGDYAATLQAMLEAGSRIPDLSLGSPAVLALISTWEKAPE